MRLFLLLALLSGSSSVVALAQPTEAPPPNVKAPARVPRPGTPQEQIEADLKGLIVTLNAVQPDQLPTSFTVPSSIVGGRIGFFGLSEWTDYFAAMRGATRYRLDKIDVLTQEKDAARVKVLYTLTTPINIQRADEEATQRPPDERQVEETFDLKRENVSWEPNEEWHIVPPSFEKLKPYSTLSLNHIAYYGSQRAGTLSQLRAEVSATRLKQIGLGVMQFVQDYDELFLFQNDFWREAIKPYVKNDSLFFIPGTQTPYTFNDNLSAKNMVNINDPAKTVLFYESDDEEPVFRYNGKAVIGFADGHVGFVSPKEVNDLIWKP